MICTNQTSEDYWFGPLHLPAGIGQQLTVDDTSATSLYLTSDVVADAINNLYTAGKITVTSEALPFPRPTGDPTLLHGEGSPDGLVFAPQGSAYMRRDNSGAGDALYAKTTGTTISTGWQAFAGAVVLTPATTLPGSPTDGQQAILVDSTSAPTFVWLLQYSATASVWLFLGGAPMVSEVLAAETTTSTTFADLSTVGPSLTIPCAGTYLVDWGAQFATGGSTAAGAGEVGVEYGGVAISGSSDTVSHTFAASSAGYFTSYARRQRAKTGLTAGEAVKCRYRCTEGSPGAEFYNRMLTITPLSLT